MEPSSPSRLSRKLLLQSCLAVQRFIIQLPGFFLHSTRPVDCYLAILLLAGIAVRRWEAEDIEGAKLQTSLCCYCHTDLISDCVKKEVEMCALSEDEGYFNILQLIPSQSRMKILAIDDAQIRKEVKLRTQPVKKSSVHPE